MLRRGRCVPRGERPAAAVVVTSAQGTHRSTTDCSGSVDYRTMVYGAYASAGDDRNQMSRFLPYVLSSEDLNGGERKKTRSERVTHVGSAVPQAHQRALRLYAFK
uniref:Uncharacterized protein n=1 Tax=Sipha flava TaxID=143950 RepID=A0A2S2Q0V9_9HEMI